MLVIAHLNSKEVTSNFWYQLFEFFYSQYVDHSKSSLIDDDVNFSNKGWNNIEEIILNVLEIAKDYTEEPKVNSINVLRLSNSKRNWISLNMKK